MRVFLRIDPDVLAAFPTRMRILATLTECAGIRWPLSRDTAGRDRFEKLRSQARESDLFHRRGCWWLRVTGKGGVEGDVPISDVLMADFARYRAFFGLPVVPASDSSRPLILGIAGREEPLTATAVYLVVKDALGRVADVLAPADPTGAARLRQASTHWLRHTAVTHQAEAGNPVHHIQHNLRHSSIATTSIYLHAKEDARHASATQARAAITTSKERP